MQRVAADLQIGFLCGGDAGAGLVDAIACHAVAFTLAEVHGEKHLAQVVVVDAAVGAIIHPHTVPSATSAIEVIAADDRAADARDNDARLRAQQLIVSHCGMIGGTAVFRIGHTIDAGRHRNLAFLCNRPHDVVGDGCMGAAGPDAAPRSGEQVDLIAAHLALSSFNIYCVEAGIQVIAHLCDIGGKLILRDTGTAADAITRYQRTHSVMAQRDTDPEMADAVVFDAAWLGVIGVDAYAVLAERAAGLVEEQAGDAVDGVVHDAQAALIIAAQDADDKIVQTICD